MSKDNIVNLSLFRAARRGRQPLATAIQEASQREAWYESEELARYFQNHGVKAAAWLIAKHRKTFVKVGVVDFKIPVEKTIPPFFKLAMVTLESRRGWTVRSRLVYTGKKGTRTFRVEWRCPALQPNSSKT